MLQAILKLASVERLQGLIRDRYGKRLKIDWMKQVSSLEFIDGDHEIKNNNLHVPIQVEQRYFATAVVEGVEALSTQDHLMISQLIKMVLEPEFYNWYLGQMAHNAASASTGHNLVSIFNLYDLRDDNESDLENEPPAYATNVIFFQSENPHLIPRLCHQVHEVSGRWASLKFKDIQSQVHTPEDIRSLGSLTLMIDDVLELSPEHQTLIYQYLKAAHPDQEPLLVIGSSSRLESLESQQMIHEGLAQVLKSHRLEAERLPRDSKLLNDALEIMLEN